MLNLELGIFLFPPGKVKILYIIPLILWGHRIIGMAIAKYMYS